MSFLPRAGSGIPAAWPSSAQAASASELRYGLRTNHLGGQDPAPVQISHRRIKGLSSSRTWPLSELPLRILMPHATSTDSSAHASAHIDPLLRRDCVCSHVRLRAVCRSRQATGFSRLKEGDILYYTIYYTVPSDAMLCNLVLLLYCTLLHCAVLCYTLLYYPTCTRLYYIISHCISLEGTLTQLDHELNSQLLLLPPGSRTDYARLHKKQVFSC